MGKYNLKTKDPRATAPVSPAGDVKNGVQTSRNGGRHPGEKGLVRDRKRGVSVWDWQASLPALRM